MKSGLLYSALSAISSLVSLLVILLCIWIVSRGSRGSTRENVTDETLFKLPKVRPRGEITIWIGSMLMMLAVGLGTGYGLRNHELAANSWTYTDVSIVRRIAEREYVVWPDRMKQMHIRVCPESSVDWYDGDVLNDWTFEQRPNCKRVVSYHKKPKGEVDASAQLPIR